MSETKKVALPPVPSPKAIDPSGQGTGGRVGILGGSFNPPHLGHRAMAKLALEEGRVDEIWVIPCFEHPFDKPLLPFEHRYQMCRLAFQDLEKVKVIELEKRLGGKSYTLRTFQTLQRENPNLSFYLVIGEDVKEEAKRWHEYEALTKVAEWVVLPRGEGSPIPNISATEIRKALPERKNLEKKLSKSVIGYIEKYQLYK